MTRTVPSALQTHKNQTVTTTCRLLRIETRESSPVVFGFTTLDQAVTYDDGDGEVTYHALRGFDASTLRTDVGYSVDNAEVQGLISDDVEPELSLEDIERGALDDATWKMYEVNFKSLGDGHILLDGGDIGQVRTRYGMAWFPELLSHTVRWRQPVGHVDQKTCRAIFGSPADSPTGCGVDADALWTSGTVSAVGTETDTTFNGSAAVDVPARVRWLTGDNAGREYWLDDRSGSTMRLGESARFPIQVGDTYEIRPDCGKLYIQWCIYVYDNGVNFKGEPYIPVGDASQVQTPGAQLPGGGGFVGTSQSSE